jgi:hypothetical protein
MATCAMTAPFRLSGQTFFVLRGSRILTETPIRWKLDATDCIKALTSAGCAGRICLATRSMWSTASWKATMSTQAVRAPWTRRRSRKPDLVLVTPEMLLTNRSRKAVIGPTCLASRNNVGSSGRLRGQREQWRPGTRQVQDSSSRSSNYLRVKYEGIYPLTVWPSRSRDNVNGGGPLSAQCWQGLLWHDVCWGLYCCREGGDTRLGRRYASRSGFERLE